MPDHATSNQLIQQMYIYAHFCYTYKFSIVTNGLGIVHNISFYNKHFLNAHANIILEKQSNSLDNDKFLANSKMLLSVLIDFFPKHPLIKNFLENAALNTIKIYKFLFGYIRIP